MEKDINFYRECLRRELSKPFNKQDFMYMRYLDEIINSKVRDNYLAEIIVVLVITIILLNSCGSTKKCCIKTANDVYKYEGMYTNQEWEDIN